MAQYLRSYWWFAAIIPLFGVIATIVGSGLLRGMGIFALLWPFTLPARAIVASSKTGKLLEKGAWASFEEGFFYLHGENGQGFKMSLGSVRRVDRRMGFFVLVIPRGAFIPIPLSAASEDFQRGTEEQIDAVRALRAASNEDIKPEDPA